jgi:hypothetical protein
VDRVYNTELHKTTKIFHFYDFMMRAVQTCFAFFQDLWDKSQQARRGCPAPAFLEKGRKKALRMSLNRKRG